MKVYITEQGDTWDLIAKKVYGDETELEQLMEFNFEHINTFVFESGIEIVVPELEEDEEMDLPDWRVDEEDDEE